MVRIKARLRQVLLRELAPTLSGVADYRQAIDVVMPVMSGRELVERVRPMRPEAKIMYMSGYPADVIGKHGVLVSGGFVQKPFTPSGLVEEVREVFRT